MTVILGVCLTVMSTIWNEFLRTRSRGIVTGRVLSLSAPWAGVIKSLHVRQGQQVAQGDLIAVLENMELQLQIGKLDDDIRLAQAGLAAAVAEIRTTQRAQDHQILLDFVEYLKILSRLGAEQARLTSLEASSARMQGLLETRAVPPSEYDAVRYARDGQIQRVEKLKLAAARLQAGLEVLDAETDDISPLSLAQARLESLMHQRQRLMDYYRVGEIRAPVTGRVVERNPLTGETVAAGTTICQILEAGSIEVVLYVSQARAGEYPIGSVKYCSMPVTVPGSEFKVTRVGQQLVSPPRSLQRFSPRGTRLVPVFLAPCTPRTRELLETTGVWLGAEVLEPRCQWPWRALDRSDVSLAGTAR